jgi:hypothetical protein
MWHRRCAVSFIKKCFDWSETNSGHSFQCSITDRAIPLSVDQSQTIPDIDRGTTNYQKLFWKSPPGVRNFQALIHQGEVLPVAKGMMKAKKEVEVQVHSFFTTQEGGQFHMSGCFTLICSNSTLDHYGHGGKNTTAAESWSNFNWIARCCHLIDWAISASTRIMLNVQHV